MLSDIVNNDVDYIWKNISIEEIKGKTILLTGGTGVLGSYFIHTINKFNENVENKATVYFVIHRGIPVFLDMLEEKPWIKMIQGDLTDLDFCRSLPNADIIIHAAGYGQPSLFMGDKLNTIRVNTFATDILLSKLNKNGRFLYISSSEIYSGSDRYPYIESEYGCTTPQHPRSCYIEGKRCGESLCMAYAEKGYDVKIARVSLAYGPCFKRGDKRVIYDFIEKARKGNIDLIDSGSAQRVYCYVSDAVELLWKIMLNGKEIVYNVGGDSQITIRNLADMVAKEMEAEVSVPLVEEGMKDAPKVVYMNIDKVKDEFNKRNFIDLAEGVRRTVKWYLDTYNR